MKMIKHIVFWKIKDGNKKENMQRMKQLLEGLQGRIPGLLKAEVGFAIDSGKHYDVALYSEFLSKEALDAYQDHPEHLVVKSFVRSVITARSCVDYEI